MTVMTYPEEPEMDETYRLAMLAEAHDAVEAARGDVARALTATARRLASEEVEFWMSKKAYLIAAERETVAR